MIIFKEVTLKNFLSYGDNTTKIILDKSPTTLIAASNGIGKSSVLDAICFALFGKSFRNINKKNLINTINQRDSAVTLSFISGNKSYIITRGQKPNIFTITEDGKTLNEDASVADTQAFLEKQILKFDFNVFSRVVVMSSMNYTAFLHLTPNERRTFVESILNLSVFSEMSKQHKANIATLKDKVNTAITSIDKYQALIKEKENFLAYIKSKDSTSKSNLKERLEKSMNEITSLKSNLKSLVDDIASSESMAELQSIKDQKATIQSDIKKIEADIIKDEYEAKQLKSSMKWLSDNCECDKCSQAIQDAHRTSMLNSLDETYKTISERLEQNHAHLVRTQTHLSDLTKQETDIKTTLSAKLESKTDIEYQINAQMNQSKLLMKELENYKEANSDEIGQIMNELSSIKQDYDEAVTAFNRYSEQSSLLNIASDLLKDEGIKSEIIAKYIPVLVKYTNHYLTKMNTSMKFNLDENFNDAITVRYANEYGYNNLSAGERARIDIALNLAWIKTAKLKGGIDTNLLFLDEIADNALDQAGTLAIIDIINELSNEGMNIFIVSHKANLEEHVRSILTLEKVNGFTKIV